MPYTRSGIVSYAAYPSSGSYGGILCVRVLTDGYPLRGVDHFLNLSAMYSHWPATFESGELEFNEESRIIVKRVKVRTFSEEDRVGPDLIVGLKGVYDREWRYNSDTVGSIAVGAADCIGTGTAWSHVIAIGDNSDDTFTLPVEVSRCSVYLDSVLTTAYTAVEDEITFTAAPGTGVTITAFWEGSPAVKMKYSDFVKTGEGYHRVTKVSTATAVDLEWYPVSGTGVIGMHLPAYRVFPGERETSVPVNMLLDRPQVQILMLARNHPTAAKIAKLLGFTVEYELVGQKQDEKPKV